MDPFQSSPTSKGGRYGAVGHQERRAARFQSSPTSKGGRYWTALRRARIAPDVSILAHLERWALLVSASAVPEAIKVSILAHLERWALQ